MLRSVLTLVIRHFTRHQVYSILNLTGLVVGITTSLLVLIWVVDELNQDRYHPDTERVFMVLRDVTLQDGQKLIGETTPGPLADYIKASIPEVEIVSKTGFGERLAITPVADEFKSIYADVSIVESEYFKLFSLTFIKGDLNNPFPDNQSIILSDNLAKSLFGSEDEAMGKVVSIYDSFSFKVAGIYHLPENFTFQTEAYIPFFYHQMMELSTWDDSNAYLYVKLVEGKTPEAVAAKLTSKIHEVWPTKGTTIFLFRQTDFHLYWETVVSGQPSSKVRYIVGFAIVGLFILAMACVNFINLATARAAIRAREIGVRKMSGATRTDLIKQFLAESFAITLIATGFALLLVYLFMPFFNSLTGKNISFSVFDTPVWIGLLVITLVTGLLAGGYPAFLLSAMKPASVLKGSLFSALTGSGLRKSLIVFQFTLSIMMIFGITVIQQQISYLRNKNLGFDKNNVLYIEPGLLNSLPIDVFKTEVLRNPNVSFISEAAASPMEINGVGDISWKIDGTTQTMNINNNPVDHNYLPALGIEIILGRNFSPDRASDSTAVIITESAANSMGFENPIGQFVDYGFTSKSEIIGVVKDFHNANIHDAIAPVAFYLGNENTFGRWKRIFVRYKPGTQIEVVKYVENLIKKLSPDLPLECRFVDQDFENQFRGDTRIALLTLFFTFIAIAIACLGLFGLTLFNTQRRTKEIGVRKVLGATIPDIIVLLCREFFKPIFLAFIIALPLAAYIMNGFLESYLFHINISIYPFVITIIAILVLAGVTVSIQSLQAARKNPTDALKTD